MIRLSVILSTHAPHAGRLARTLAGLAAQTLPFTEWELLLVDNASPQPVPVPAALAGTLPLRLVREPSLGLTSARRRGFSEARGAICILVDDDNVLAPGYLADALARLDAHPSVTVAGGPVRPEFETPPPAWTAEFQPLLALRDLGRDAIVSTLVRAPEGYFQYPPSAPIGAGMVIRTAAALAWAADADGSPLTDRRGSALSSGGDNDIVLHALRGGHACAYFPELALTHLIPAGRLEAAYLARLNRGIQQSWMQVLYRHEANPWPRLSPLSALLRQTKAWFTCQAWRHPAGAIRWAGARGHFAGRVHPT